MAVILHLRSVGTVSGLQDHGHMIMYARPVLALLGPYYASLLLCAPHFPPPPPPHTHWTCTPDPLPVLLTLLPLRLSAFPLPLLGTLLVSLSAGGRVLGGQVEGGGGLPHCGVQEVVNGAMCIGQSHHHHLPSTLLCHSMM